MHQLLRLILLAILFACSHFPCNGQIADSTTTTSTTAAAHIYSKPRPFSFLTNTPKDVWATTKSPFEKNGWKGFLAVAATSAILIHYDQKLLDVVASGCKRIHLESQTSYKTLITIKNGKEGIKIFKVPQNLNSAFYTLGEGWIGVAIGGGFWLQGKFSNNYRSLQTASDLMEGFLSTAFLAEGVKHIAGRESPFMRTAPGGQWRPFPSFHEFQANTPRYDGFPSGHLSTMMTTVTILAENYPENKWIKPVGYSLMALTAIGMMNTEVHWAGDYPLALAFGYLNGKIISGRHKQPRQLKQIL